MRNFLPFLNGSALRIGQLPIGIATWQFTLHRSRVDMGIAYR